MAVEKPFESQTMRKKDVGLSVAALSPGNSGKTATKRYWADEITTEKGMN
jgi:hypothetical protein